MILSDLLGSPVVADGRKVGHVVDARFAIDGTPHHLLADARLVGLVVAPRYRDGVLGYERTSVRSPALLAWFFRRRERDAVLVAWDDVLTVADGQVELVADYTRWSPAL